MADDRKERQEMKMAPTLTEEEIAQEIGMQALQKVIALKQERLRHNNALSKKDAEIKKLREALQGTENPAEPVDK